VTIPQKVSETFDPTKWRTIEGFEDLTDITYHRGVDRTGDTERDVPVVRIAFNRPEVRNAFRPHTVDELYRALDHARMTSSVGTVLLTGNGPSAKDGGWAFCSGGDQRIRSRSGYRYVTDNAVETADGIDPAQAGRLHILEVQRLIRTMPKVVISVVNGWAAGGGHSLHVVSDLSIASRQHARFKQTDANVGSFDGGYGSAYLAKQIGQKRAREISSPASTPRRTPTTGARSTRWPTMRISRTLPSSTPGSSRPNPRRRSACSSSRSTSPMTA
jgi:naphthoate synthase